MRCPGNCGTIVRSEKGAKGIHLALENLDIPPGGGKGKHLIRQDPLAFYQKAIKVNGKGGDDVGRVVSGYAGVYQALNAKIEAGYRSLALRDDYDFWKAHSEDDDAGKPLLLPADSIAQDTHILFDDNILRDRSHIVDPRDAVSGEHLTFDSVIRRHIVRVDPVGVVLDPSYYTKAIGSCEMEIRSGLSIALASRS